MRDLRQLALFLAVGGFAALVNIVARILFNRFVGYEAAIVLAFPVALTVAFVLNRQFVFAPSATPATVQFLRFLLVNLVALVQVLLVGLALARLVLPALGVGGDAETIAHAAGVISTAFTSFVAHRGYTFAAGGSRGAAAPPRDDRRR